MTGPNARILVVEDDEILRDTLEEVMIDEGHEVRSAGNGLVALELLESWTPELIILDLMMPYMDAYEFRVRQRARELAPDAPILILSAARDLQGAADRIAADAWLPKPFRLTEVIDTVDRLLRDRVA
jgi:CheY-like chemotaxis protein